jgi:hypothetical protein
MRAVGHYPGRSYQKKQRTSLEGALESLELPDRLAWPLCSQRPHVGKVEGGLLISVLAQRAHKGDQIFI